MNSDEHLYTVSNCDWQFLRMCIARICSSDTVISGSCLCAEIGWRHSVTAIDIPGQLAKDRRYFLCMSAEATKNDAWNVLDSDDGCTEYKHTLHPSGSRYVSMFCTTVPVPPGTPELEDWRLRWEGLCPVLSVILTVVERITGMVPIQTLPPPPGHCYPTTDSDHDEQSADMAIESIVSEQVDALEQTLGNLGEIPRILVCSYLYHRA